MSQPASAESPRVAREKRTIRAMIEIYCRGRHEAAEALCPECQGLLVYAFRRLSCCPFGPQKTACAQCPIHCYKPEMRQRVKEVMRYAGPRMLYRHPILALLHQLEGLGKKPEGLPPKPPAADSQEPQRP